MIWANRSETPLVFKVLRSKYIFEPQKWITARFILSGCPAYPFILNVFLPDVWPILVALVGLVCHWGACREPWDHWFVTGGADY